MRKRRTVKSKGKRKPIKQEGWGALLAVELQASQGARMPTENLIGSVNVTADNGCVADALRRKRVSITDYLGIQIFIFEHSHGQVYADTDGNTYSHLTSPDSSIYCCSTLPVDVKRKFI